MTWINQLLEQHYMLDQKWEKKKEKLDEKRKQIREEQEKFIEEFAAKMTSLDKKMDSHWNKHPHHTDTILEPIAEKIAKKLKLSYEISGPFGLNNHYYLSFLDKDKKIVYILYLRPTIENWYGVVTNKIIDKTVHPNSIAGMNDDHKEVIPLPKSVKGIIQFMEKKK